MRKAEIRHKCITIARETFRKHSEAKSGGCSIFIKRCYKTYKIMAMRVTAKQRTLRDLFGEAQRMAKEELSQEGRRELWEKYAQENGIKGAHRAAVSYYYKLLTKKSQQEKEETKREFCSSISISRLTRMGMCTGNREDSKKDGEEHCDYKAETERNRKVVLWHSHTKIKEAIEIDERQEEQRQRKMYSFERKKVWQRTG